MEKNRWPYFTSKLVGDTLELMSVVEGKEQDHVVRRSLRFIDDCDRLQHSLIAVREFVQDCYKYQKFGL